MFKGLVTTGINSLMTVLLLGLLALPITSLGLATVKNNLPQTQVLSAQDEISQDCSCPKIIITPQMEREIYEKVLKEEKEKQEAITTEATSKIEELIETEKIDEREDNLNE
ncbi:hypothetical protein KBG31_00300 [Patescibacteria group bacterium]|nr:hypothetical protein [Patescibacteria group bacterium]HOM78160.1 hypothetical protein [bacterium]